MGHEGNAARPESPGRRLGMLHRLSMAFLSGPLDELGVRRGHVAFLMHVLEGNGPTQDELSCRLCIDRAATARALQALEEQGLVRREENPEDRRSKHVFPTDKALGLRRRLLKVLDKHNEALFAGLNTKQKREYTDMLDRLVTNLKKALGKDC